MKAIIVIRMTHFLAYSFQALLHKIKNIIPACNKIFWVRPIFGSVVGGDTFNILF